MADDAIVPDDKDWTWVLRRPCPECGVDVTAFPVTTVAGLIRANASSWADVLAGPADALRQRSHAGRWSTLEYGAHVRDVFRLYRVRLLLMLERDDPLFADWDQDETARVERYGEQDPAVVRTELVEAAAALADAFDGVEGEQWQRPGRRSDGASFTVDTFARYMIHDPMHHLWDVTAAR